MKKKVLISAVAVCLVALLVSVTACSSGTGFWKVSNIGPDVVEKIELVNVGGTIKTLEGETLQNFMDELGQLSVHKDDSAYPDNSYDYKLRIYISYKDGYISYDLGKELKKVDIKSGAKEGFYVFENYDAARDLVAKYFYAK